MNRLYSILTYKIPVIGNGDPFRKKRESVFLPDKDIGLVDYLIGYKGTAQDSDITRLSCLICWNVRYTQFWEEIKKLDPDNTYVDVMEYARTAAADTVYDLIRPEGTQQILMTSIDTDIKDRLYAPTWIELAGGISLQILRDLYV